MCNSCASLVGLVLCFIASFILLVIAPLLTLDDGGRQLRQRLASTERDNVTSTPPSPVESIQHLDDNERRQGHRRRFIVSENVAVDSAKALVLYETLRLVRLIEHRHRKHAIPLT